MGARDFGVVWRLILKSLCPRVLMSISNIEVNKGQRFSKMGALTRINVAPGFVDCVFSFPRVYIEPALVSEAYGPAI
jgi:hypothetical protein